MSLWAIGAVVPLAACVTGIMVARHWFVAVTVTGVSMEPTLRSGDRVLVLRRGSVPFRIGAIVVFREPGEDNVPGTPARGTASQRWVIKRIAALPGGTVPDSVRSADGSVVVPAGMLVVLGDGAHSGDSRQWGFIPTDQVLGLVVRKLSPSRRFRD